MQGGKGLHTQASKGILAVNVHGAATADTLTATSAERQSRVKLVLDTDNSIQHHGARLVEVESVALHARLFGGRVGVPAVDLERLHSRFRLRGRAFADRGHGTRKDGARAKSGGRPGGAAENSR